MIIALIIVTALAAGGATVHGMAGRTQMVNRTADHSAAGVWHAMPRADRDMFVYRARELDPGMRIQWGSFWCTLQELRDHARKQGKA